VPKFSSPLEYLRHVRTSGGRLSATPPLLTMAASDFTPSFGPWELLDDNGLYHFTPNETHLQEVATADGLHLPDLRKLVGREKGNLKKGGRSEHSQHWTTCVGRPLHQARRFR
jgi:hypothetical protein